MTAACSRCGKDKGPRRHKWCAPCFNAQRTTRWRARKIALVEARGGKCAGCGFTPIRKSDYAALDFHHIDPSTKDMTMGGNWLLSRNAVLEAEKCVVLCANCHRMHHAQDWDA